MKEAIERGHPTTLISAGTAPGRGVELQGDSPELIAFVLLKNIVQLEQAKNNPDVFEKSWLLETYAECVEVVRGGRAALPKSDGGAGGGPGTPS